MNTARSNGKRDMVPWMVDVESIDVVVVASVVVVVVVVVEFVFHSSGM